MVMTNFDNFGDLAGLPPFLGLAFSSLFLPSILSADSYSTLADRNWFKSIPPYFIIYRLKEGLLVSKVLFLGWELLVLLFTIKVLSMLLTIWFVFCYSYFTPPDAIFQFS
jgi:hypothetical protein